MGGIKQMSDTFKWCQDKTRLTIYDKQVFQIYRDGNKWWYLNGEYHRENGPAVEYTNGNKYWFLNGEFHRENGPAIEDVNGDKSWFLNGKYCTETTYWKKLKGLKRLYKLKILNEWCVHLIGVKIKLN